MIKIGFVCVVAATLAMGAGSYFFMRSQQERKILNEQFRSTAPGKFVTLKHGKVHYILAGDKSSELIVLIHGGGVTGLEVWKRNIPFFISKGYQALAFDLYGRGYSARPEIENCPELFLEELTSLLDSLHLSRPFYLLSMSMGATVAISYTENHFARVKKLVLIDPASTGDYRPNPLLKVPIVADFMLTVGWYPRAVENQRKEFVDQKLFNEYAQRLNYFMEFEGYKFTNYSTWMNMLSQDWLAKTGAFPHLPVLLLYGDKDPYFNIQQVDRYRSKLPLLRISEIRDAGHMPHYEKPEEANQIIYSFLTNSVK